MNRNAGKENSDDYRYFPDPDCLTKNENSLINLISKTLPELQKLQRKVREKICLSKEVMLVILSKRKI